MTIKGVDCLIKSGNDGKRKPGNDEKGKSHPAGRAPSAGEA